MNRAPTTLLVFMTRLNSDKDMTKNSLCFAPFKVCRVRAIYEGKELPGSLKESQVGETVSKDGGTKMEALHWYEKLHELSGFGQSDSMGINFEDFHDGVCVFVIHVSPPPLYNQPTLILYKYKSSSSSDARRRHRQCG